MGLLQRTWNRFKNSVASFFTGIYNFFAGIFNWFANKIFPAPSQFSAHETMIISLNNDMLPKGEKYGNTHIFGTIYAMLRALVISSPDSSLVTSSYEDLRRCEMKNNGESVDRIHRPGVISRFLDKITSQFYKNNANSRINLRGLETFFAYIYKQDARFYLHEQMHEGKIQFCNKNDTKGKKCIICEPYSGLEPDWTKIFQATSLNIDGTIVTFTDERYSFIDIDHPDEPMIKGEKFRNVLSDYKVTDATPLNRKSVLKYLHENNMPPSLHWKYQISVDFSKLDLNNDGNFLPNSHAIVQSFTLDAVDPNLKILVHKDLNPYMQHSLKSKAEDEAPTAIAVADASVAIPVKPKSTFAKLLRPFMSVGAKENSIKPTPEAKAQNGDKHIYKKKAD